jgi:hypothetical protein
LNYDVERRPSVENVRITLKLPAAKRARDVRLVSPDAESTLDAALQTSGASVSFVVPRVRTYTIAAVELQ